MVFKNKKITLLCPVYTNFLILNLHERSIDRSYKFKIKKNKTTLDYYSVCFGVCLGFFFLAFTCEIPILNLPCAAFCSSERVD